MTDIFTYICAHADVAHYIFFGLLCLAGLNVPISEDIILLTGGAIVSRCIPDQYIHLYLWIYFGSWLSASESYWLGRIFGEKLYTVPGFRHVINKHRIEKLHTYYERFGIWTFIVGRFIPGGVRNALFLTSGMGKMPYGLFLLRDGIAALISTSTIFYLGYLFAQNYEWLVEQVTQYNRIAFILVVSLVSIACARIWWRVRQE